MANTNDQRNTCHSTFHIPSQVIPASQMEKLKKKGVNVDKVRKDYAKSGGTAANRSSSAAPAPRRQEGDVIKRAGSAKTAKNVTNRMDNNDPAEDICFPFMYGMCQHQDKPTCSRGRNIPEEQYREERKKWKAGQCLCSHLRSV